MGANDVHGAYLHMTLPGSTADRNESETIIEHNHFVLVRAREAQQYPGLGFRIRSRPHRTELSLVRFENVGLRYWLGPIDFCATSFS